MYYDRIAFDRDVITNTIMSAIETRDVVTIENMMCENIKQNTESLAEKIGNLIDAIDGNFSSYRRSNTGGYSKTDGGKSVETASWDIYFSTAKQKYRLLITWEITNNYAPEEKGIRFFTLIEDISPDFPELVEIAATKPSWEL